MELYEIKEKELELFEKVKNKLYTSKAFRVEYFKNNFYSFCLFYFPQYFSYPSADFHRDWAKNLQSGKHCFIIWARELWKTVYTILYLVWVIVYHKRNFIIFYSYEKKISASRLFDLIVHLQTNQRLKADFWDLFPSKRDKEELEKKSVSEFITTNKVKVKAMSMGETSRWQLYKQFRPDLLALDDIDNILTVRNPEVIDKNYDFLKWEVFGGLDAFAKIIFLWNIISTDWLVPRHRQDVVWDDNRYISEIRALKNWLPTWDRFVLTDLEQLEWLNKWIKKISLETKQREQKDNFWPNYLLIPNIRLWSPVFVQEIIQKLPILEYKEDTRYKWLRIYRQPVKDLFWWVDTASGWNGDFSTITIRDSQFNLYAEFQDKIPPDLLVDVISHLVSLWYKGLIWIENNSIWLATINKAKEQTYRNLLYVERTLDKITSKTQMKFWFNTNSKTKPLIITRLEELIREWHITEFDERTKNDLLHYYYDDNGSTNALKWFHDDLVMSNAICLQMMNVPKQVVFW